MLTENHEAFNAHHAHAHYNIWALDNYELTLDALIEFPSTGRPYHNNHHSWAGCCVHRWPQQEKPHGSWPQVLPAGAALSTRQWQTRKRQFSVCVSVWEAVGA